jgi:hypothetical protein
MSAASDYLEDAVLDHVLGNSQYTQPTLYLGLWTADDGLESGTLTSEVPNANGYARQEIDVDGVSGAFDTASGGSTSNTQTITFPTANGGNWGTITHIAVMDAATHGAGNVLFHGSVTSSKTIEDGDTFQVSAGNLTISLD